MMKLLMVLLCLITGTLACHAQFYYKDQLVPRQNSAQWKLYKDNRVKAVKLSSFEGDGKPTDGFTGELEVTGDFSRIMSHTQIASTGNPESWIISNYSAQGLLIKNTDTSDTYRSVTDYQYDPQGRPLSILNTSIETDNHLEETELHTWQYDAGGKPVGMLKIKNGKDTTFVRFIQDEKGNIAEERAVRNKTELPAVYYYYDTDNRLTDIVRYNLKAQRLLPDDVFEYGVGGRLTTMLVVPEGTNDYQKWFYEYDDKGLKTKDTCYNRRSQLLGKIEYHYSLK